MKPGATWSSRARSTSGLSSRERARKYKGKGTINGGGSYGFLLTAIDGDVSGGGGSGAAVHRAALGSDAVRCTTPRTALEPNGQAERHPHVLPFVGDRVPGVAQWEVASIPSEGVHSGFDQQVRRLG
jgi:hypothetical protein